MTATEYQLERSLENHQQKQLINRICCGLIFLYLISLCLPAVKGSLRSNVQGLPEDQWLTGFDCLFFGFAFLQYWFLFSWFPFMTLIYPHFSVLPAIPWLANFVFYLGLLLLWKRDHISASCCGLTATLMACTAFFFIPEPVMNSRPGSFALGSGYFAWQLCMTLLAFSTYWVTVHGRERGTDPNSPAKTQL